MGSLTFPGIVQEHDRLERAEAFVGEQVLILGEGEVDVVL